MKHLFDPTKPHFAAWVWLYDIDRYWTECMLTMHPTQPEAMPLYCASLCGFGDLAEHLIAAHSPDVNGQGGSHTTPLHAASVKGHLQVASLLLKNEATFPLALKPQNRQGDRHLFIQCHHGICRRLLAPSRRRLCRQ
jgi:ankyrin repeat protein